MLDMFDLFAECIFFPSKRLHYLDWIKIIIIKQIIGGSSYGISKTIQGICWYYTIYNLFLYIFCPNSEACLIHHHHPMRHKIDISLVCIVHMYVIHFCSSVLYLTFILTCHVYNMKLIFPFLSFRYPSHIWDSINHSLLLRSLSFGNATRVLTAALHIIWQKGLLTTNFTAVTFFPFLLLD